MNSNLYTRNWVKSLSILLLSLQYFHGNPVLAREPIRGGSYNSLRARPYSEGKVSPCALALDFGNPCKVINFPKVGLKALIPSNWKISSLGENCVKISTPFWTENGSHVALCPTSAGARCSNIKSSKSINCDCLQSPFAVAVWQKTNGMCRDVSVNTKSHWDPNYSFLDTLSDALTQIQECTVPQWDDDPCQDLNSVQTAGKFPGDDSIGLIDERSDSVLLKSSGSAHSGVSPIRTPVED